MAKSPKKRSYVWIISLLIGAIGMAALRNAMLSGLCLWLSIIMTIVVAFKSSPRPTGRSVDAGDWDEGHGDSQWRNKRGRDGWREEDYYQDGFDAEQREHEDHGEV